ncbi:RNA polymerase subunit sigma-24 [Fulvitalea axinellae]|uniref:RNA polymerase subunit sigma-24 n=1 Tax=Fulvitalea axinellae TaxID=1182444 RepID=A0AAU9D6W2_9BACT|nr:RNA polymerase subunit sigma-24 [Fulvitalea axinellae]
MRTVSEDTRLIKEFIGGRKGSFDILCGKYYDRVLNKIRAIVKSEDVAEDLAQEVFIKALDTIKSGNYKEEGKFLPWLMRSAHNRAIDWFRKTQRYPMMSAEENPNVFSDVDFRELSREDQQIKNDVIKKLRSLIDELPESQRMVLQMRSYMGMSFQEIADETGVSINTALGRMRYALINLRKRMDVSDEQVLALVA